MKKTEEKNNKCIFCGENKESIKFQGKNICVDCVDEILSKI